MTISVRRRSRGSSGAPTVLLLHGLAGRAAIWDRLATRLAGDVELWDAELPWHALADERWSHRPDAENPIADLVRAGADGQPYDAVVAHSYSASVLLESLAGGLPAPARVILLSPFYRPAAQDFDWPAISHYLNDFHLIFEEALQLGETARFPAERRSWMARQMRDKVGPYGWTRWFERYLRTPFLDLTRVAVPLLVITGDRDIAARPDDGRQLAKALPDGHFTLLADCGHFPMLEQADLLARLVRDFTRTPQSHDSHLEPT